MSINYRRFDTPRLLQPSILSYTASPSRLCISVEGGAFHLDSGIAVTSRGVIVIWRRLLVIIILETALVFITRLCLALGQLQTTHLRRLRRHIARRLALHGGTGLRR